MTYGRLKSLPFFICDKLVTSFLSILGQDDDRSSIIDRGEIRSIYFFTWSVSAHPLWMDELHFKWIHPMLCNSWLEGFGQPLPPVKGYTWRAGTDEPSGGRNR